MWQFHDFISGTIFFSQSFSNCYWYLYWDFIVWLKTSDRRSILFVNERKKKMDCWIAGRNWVQGTERISTLITGPKSPISFCGRDGIESGVSQIIIRQSNPSTTLSIINNQNYMDLSLAHIYILKNDKASISAADFEKLSLRSPFLILYWAAFPREILSPSWMANDDVVEERLLGKLFSDSYGDRWRRLCPRD